MIYAGSRITPSPSPHSVDTGTCLTFSTLQSDVLSFYKEELAGEAGNYMSDRARACGKSAQDTLQEVIDETVATVARVRKLSAEGPPRDAWEPFARGWIAFHMHSPRYRLKGLIDCEYIAMESIG